MLTVIAALVAAAWASGSVTKSGLYGNVSRGPIAPVCAAEQSCTAPARGVVLRFTRAGVTTTTRTTADGTYRLRLTPGTYAVAPAAGGRIEPNLVHIRSGHFWHVDLAIDTGIR
jgi:hypothetical protein